MPQMTDSAGSQLKKYGTGLKSRPIYVKLRPNLESRVTLLFIFVYQLSFYHNQIPATKIWIQMNNGNKDWLA